MSKQTVISWKENYSTIKEGKRSTHSITSIDIDSFSSMVRVVIEKESNVETVHFSMDHAIHIGFINLEPLKKYCK